MFGGGYVFIYDVNVTSLLGRAFYSVVPLLFPDLKKEIEEEMPYMIELSSKWEIFIECLQQYFTRVKQSTKGFYVSFVGKRK